MDPTTLANIMMATSPVPGTGWSSSPISGSIVRAPITPMPPTGSPLNITPTIAANSATVPMMSPLTGRTDNSASNFLLSQPPPSSTQAQQSANYLNNRNPNLQQLSQLQYANQLMQPTQITTPMGGAGEVVKNIVGGLLSNPSVMTAQSQPGGIFSGLFGTGGGGSSPTVNGNGLY